jgi:adenylate cyclase
MVMIGIRVLTFSSSLQTCISTLAIRNMVRPFKNGMLEQACPMADVLAEVASQLDELKVLRQQADFEMAPS